MTEFNPTNITRTSSMFGVEAMERTDFDGAERMVLLILASDGQEHVDAAIELSPDAAREMAKRLTGAAELAEGNAPLPSITPTHPQAGRA